MLSYTVRSDPPGFVTELDGFLAAGAALQTESLNGEKDGYFFAYWSLNGVRVKGDTPEALDQVRLNISENATLVAHYVTAGADSDADGLADWFELNQFGDLAQGPGGDPDGDGFTNLQEQVLGQGPHIKDEVADGGISARVSPNLLYFQQTEVPPTLVSAEMDFSNGKLTLTFTEDVAANFDLDKAFLNDVPGTNAVGLISPLDATHDANVITVVLAQNQVDDAKAISSVVGGDETPLVFDMDAGFVEDLDGNANTPADGLAVTELLDTDGDTLQDSLELVLGTDPEKKDTDGDGIDDDKEIADGTDPKDPTSPEVSKPALTDETFRTALALWFSDEAAAIETYGHISNWNTSGVTDMSSAFRGRENFNEDIGNWNTLPMSPTCRECSKATNPSIKTLANGTPLFNKGNESHVRRCRGFQSKISGTGIRVVTESMSFQSCFEALQLAQSFNQDI